MAKIAIIGGGWSGLATAIALSAEHDVSVFERSPYLGGRARSFITPAGMYDNGQHVLLGAYSATLALLRQLHVDVDQAFMRLAFCWPASAIQLQCRRWPAPLHLLSAIVGARGLTWRDKGSLLALGHKISRRLGNADEGAQTAEHWLADCAKTVVEGLLAPICLGALNTPLNQASALSLAAVLQPILQGPRHFSDWLIPQVPLADLLANPAEKRLRALGQHIAKNTPINRLNLAENGQWRVHDNTYDAVIIATAPWHASRLLATANLDVEAQRCVAFAPRPITTVYCRYAKPLALAKPLHVLPGPIGQWAIASGEQQLSFVLSNENRQSLGLSDAALIDHLHQELACVTAPVVASKIICEKRATFACTPHRPKITSPRVSARGLYLTGDYLHPRWPATLESAILSAQSCAEAVQIDWRTC